MNLMRYPHADEYLMEKSRPLTPKADRWYDGRIASVSLFTARGLCRNGKCVRKEAHTGPCWP